MIQTVQELYELTEKPIISKINFKLLQEYYETYLMPLEYTFELHNGTIIELCFKKDKFCHLIGTESAIKTKYQNEGKRKQYKGDWGYRRIKRGELTIQSLKSEAHPRGFNSIKSKLVYFYLAPHIFNSPELMVKFKKIPGSTVDCEFILYDFLHNVYAHIGIEKDSNNGKYYPRTFLVETTTTKDGQRFIRDQEELQIVRASLKPSNIGTPLVPISPKVIVPRESE
ncbi:TPA: PBECR4 domain-containing protein [Bacillus cereus]